MSEEILIQDNVVILRTVEEHIIADPEEFMDQLVNRFGLSTPVLPGPIHYSRANDGKRSMIVVGQPPSTKILTIDRGGELGRLEYEIAVPWVIYGVVFKFEAIDKLYVFFSPEAPTRSESMLYKAPLLNISGDGLVCLGQIRFSSENTVSEKANKLIQSFWDYDFNNDITSNLRAIPKEITESIEDWTTEGWSARSNGIRIQHQKWHDLTYEGLDPTKLTWTSSKTFGDFVKEITGAKVWKF